MTTVNILMEARAEVEKGWCSTGWRSESGVCAVHAAEIAAPDHMLWVSTCDALAQALPMGAERNMDSGSQVGAFNDDPSTTKADVLALFDRAINALVPVSDAAHVHRAAA